MGVVMDDKLTIVGPEPSSRGSSVPARVNVESLLLMAKYNDEFRELLLSDRIRAIEECGIDFSDAEKLLLTSLPREKIISSIELFSMEGITRDSLPTWKEAAAVVLLVMTVLVGISCTSMHDPATVRCEELEEIDRSKVTEGWCGNDTYRVFRVGVPPSKEANLKIRKEKSRRAAVIMAQYNIIEKFMGYRIEAGGIIADDNDVNNIKKDRERLKKLFFSGKVIAEEWDSDLNCTVIFQIQKAGLRKAIMTGEAL